MKCMCGNSAGVKVLGVPICSECYREFKKIRRYINLITINR